MPDSTNPGIHPSRWFNMNQTERRKAVEQYKAEKRGFFGIEDPGPCLALLRDIGLDPVVDAPEGDEPAPPAAPEAPGPGRQMAPWMVRRQKRREELGLEHGEQPGQAAAAAEDSSTEEGSGTEYGESDDEDVWWKQTWYGGTILRDGEPTDTVGRDPWPL